jgi:hemoglobin-like flavoprotein
MSTIDVALVQKTWDMVLPIADGAAKVFYDCLFELDPSLHRMFENTDMASQRKKLMQMISVAVRGLDRLDDLIPAVEALGRRHVGYGVKDSHYVTVGRALLWTLEIGLGEAFTPEAREAWTQTYATLAGVMQRAARDATAQDPAAVTIPTSHRGGHESGKRTTSPRKLGTFSAA